MSRILKRPMFRIGGSANEEGIVSMATPRKNYEEETPDPEVMKKFKENQAILRQALGPGRSMDDRLSSLLIRGGLKTMAQRPRGGLLPTLATAFEQPVDEFLKSGEAEQAFGRQINLAAATQGISSVDAERLARVKLKAENQNQELIELTKLLQLSGVQNPYAVAKTQIDFKRNFGEEIAPTPINADSKTGKITSKQLAGIPTGQVFLINDPKIGLYAARKKDDAGNIVQINISTNKEMIKPVVEPKPTGKEFFEQYNPFSTRRNSLMQEYLKRQQEKIKNNSSTGD